ncbi:MAG: helix-turn-helix transcriptional regulator [Actinomycetota bacterium]|nr:helix-turn-helix transcriptional regulator [Actinomycetota bacterium]
MSRQTKRPDFRAVREAQGRTLNETARRARLSPSQLSRFERGEAGLSVASLARLAAVLNLTDLARALRPFAEDKS